MLKIYTSPTCKYCSRAKEHLKQQGIEFTTIDISKNKLLRDLVAENTGKLVVPAFQKGDYWLSGFDENNLNGLNDLVKI